MAKAKKQALPPNVRARWWEVWYANPRDNSRPCRIDGYRRSKENAQAVADDLMAKGMAHKPNGAWIVEVQRLKRSLV